MFGQSVFTLLYFVHVAFSLPVPVSSPHDILPSTQQKSYEISIRSRSVTSQEFEKRGDISGNATLGDVADLLYFVSLQLGNSTTSLILDTGSSDLWVKSDACRTDTCTSSTSSSYVTGAGKLTGADADLKFGDSKTGSHASGPIVLDTVSVAGIAMDDQPFVAVNDTNNSAVQNGGAGLFGLGFPSQSFVQGALVNKKFNTPSTTDDFVRDALVDGPLLSRMALSGQLEQPMFAITLQRDTIDIGGNEGALTVGRLPDGIDNSSITWIPVRLYSTEDGGLSPPTFAPDEKYPLRWEIPLDAVFLDGERLPDTNLTGTGVHSKSLSALIDTGNSLLRGPEDVVDSALKLISPQYAADSSNKASFPCATPHTISYQIGGKMFPVDPRDFVTADHDGDATNCTVKNLVTTDAPSTGSLFSWSLGAPFFRSNLVLFYFGNLTHPSFDPPRIGLLNTVPSNVNSPLVNAVSSAQSKGGKFPSKVDTALPVAVTAKVSTAFQRNAKPSAGAMVRLSDSPMANSKWSGSVTSAMFLPTAVAFCGDKLTRILHLLIVLTYFTLY